MIEETSLGHAEAQRAIQAIQTELEKRRKAAVIAVADAHGELIALLRMDGARLPSIQIAANKAWTTHASKSRPASWGRDPVTRRRALTWPILATGGISAGVVGCLFC